jgi:hypothetical protein
MDPQQQLYERLKLAYGELRSEISLNWDRQKLFLTLNPALTTLIVAVAHGWPRRLCLLSAALIALAGTLIVRRGHTRYQASRAVVLRLEDELGIQDLQTTGGQREARGGLRLERFRVVDVLVAVFLVLAVLDVALAVLR